MYSGYKFPIFYYIFFVHPSFAVFSTLEHLHLHVRQSGLLEFQVSCIYMYHKCHCWTDKRLYYHFLYIIYNQYLTVSVPESKREHCTTVLQAYCHFLSRALSKQEQGQLWKDIVLHPLKKNNQWKEPFFKHGDNTLSMFHVHLFISTSMCSVYTVILFCKQCVFQQGE